MSRETLDGDGAGAGVGQPPAAGDQAGALDLDLSLDDGPPAARTPAAGTPSGSAAAAFAPSTPASSGPVTSGYPAAPSSTPPTMPTGILRTDDRDELSGIRTEAPPAAADRTHGPAGPDGVGELDGFSADLGEERVDRKAAARAAGLPLTSVDRRRVRLAAVAAGVVLLLVLAAVGGYSEGQRAQDRDALASARVVGQMDENSLVPNYTQDGRLAEPVLLTLHLTVTASVSGTVTRVVLPTGEARLRKPVRLGPGEGTDAQLELTNLCGRAVRNRPNVTDPTVTLRPTGEDEVTLPLQLGFESQFLARESICGPTIGAGDGGDASLPTVQVMYATTSGDIVITLQSQSRDRLQVSVVPSADGAAAAQGWKVVAVPVAPVVLAPQGEAELVVRMTRSFCGSDDVLPSTNNLVGLRISSGAADQFQIEVDGVQLGNWDDNVVSTAAAVRTALQCRR